MHNEIIFSADKEAIVLQKSVSNKLKHLLDHSFSAVKSDLEYINSEFIELRELYDNHKKSKESLEEIKPDIVRHQVNISDKIDKIRLNLFEI